MTRVLAASAALLLTAACAPATVPALTASSHRPHADFDLGTTTTTPPPTTTTTRAVRASRSAGRRVGSTRPSTSPRGDRWAALRRCESGGRYDRDSGNGYYGAYQASPGTWAGYWRRHGRPDLAAKRASQATPAEQDAFAAGLYAERGAQPWPSCGRFIK